MRQNFPDHISQDARYEKKQALNQQRLKDYSSQNYALGGVVGCMSFLKFFRENLK